MISNISTPAVSFQGKISEALVNPKTLKGDFSPKVTKTSNAVDVEQAMKLTMFFNNARLTDTDCSESGKRFSKTVKIYDKETRKLYQFGFNSAKVGKFYEDPFPQGAGNSYKVGYKEFEFKPNDLPRALYLLFNKAKADFISRCQGEEVKAKYADQEAKKNLLDVIS